VFNALLGLGPGTFSLRSSLVLDAARLVRVMRAGLGKKNIFTGPPKVQALGHFEATCWFAALRMRMFAGSVRFWHLPVTALAKGSRIDFRSKTSTQSFGLPLGGNSWRNIRFIDFKPDGVS
jgi:hypothetical protein